ncbi:PA0069 family radical SAM protein [Salinarimonas soli]|uniref:PA0069 family radical SAM protein n=1 Tax=Salinarimonas soli TaxID=1638099 RepID=A0A5B2VVA2_9HYPH|nr:PA0069 family radical SAM protein [Salinarimonas soli]KAA2242177.1 PA0069 family radical SAM protein [Salinarimonas soli]
MSPPRQPLPHRGRGAVSSPHARFEPLAREGFDDGWDIAEEAPPLATDVAMEAARSIISRNDSPDIGFDRSINPYRGCEHGCVYCFARPTHAYLGLSPGLDFETKLFAKPNAAELLTRELSAPGYVPQAIALGANTDPYQPIERRLRITREVLEVLSKSGHPVGIVTKGAMVTRDLDLLGPMGRAGTAKVAVSVTTLDPVLARRMEPRASAPRKRLEAIRALSEAGVPVLVLAAPLIPGINDHELEAILEAAHAAGAREAGYVVLRLPHELKEIVRDWLVEYYPGKAERVFAILREMRGGRDYDAAFGTRLTGTGPYATLTARRFETALRRLGMARRGGLRLRTDLFVPPVRGAPGQLSLF